MMFFFCHARLLRRMRAYHRHAVTPRICRPRCDMPTRYAELTIRDVAIDDAVMLDKMLLFTPCFDI